MIRFSGGYSYGAGVMEKSRFLCLSMFRLALILSVFAFSVFPYLLLNVKTAKAKATAALSPGDVGWKPGFTHNGLENAAKAVVVDGRNVYVAGGFYSTGRYSGEPYRHVGWNDMERTR